MGKLRSMPKNRIGEEVPIRKLLTPANREGKKLRLNSLIFSGRKVVILWQRLEGKRMASGLIRNQMPGDRLRVRPPCPPLQQKEA